MRFVTTRTKSRHISRKWNKEQPCRRYVGAKHFDRDANGVRKISHEDSSIAGQNCAVAQGRRRASKVRRDDGKSAFFDAVNWVAFEDILGLDV